LPHQKRKQGNFILPKMKTRLNLWYCRSLL
jgi:hypothetical protein